MPKAPDGEPMIDILSCRNHAARRTKTTKDQIGDPPAVPGRLPILTFKAVFRFDGFVADQSYKAKRTMEDYRSLSHTKWQCKYHIVFIPKYRKRQLYGIVR